uniref:TCTP domain-containing protein n=1 Tax=Ciona savignyi TaxID=51511 RepID=H2ZD71_CIOSA
MIIFKDIITGDEMFSDIYKYEVFEECFIKVVGKMTTTKEEELDSALFGANPSQEESAESYGGDDSAKPIVDIVKTSKLEEAPRFDSKTYTSYFKDWCKAVVAKLVEEGQSDEAEKFKKQGPAGFKYIKKNIKDLEFFTGSGMDVDGSMGYLNYDENDTPYLLFFKASLVEEKC